MWLMWSRHDQHVGVRARGLGIAIAIAIAISLIRQKRRSFPASVVFSACRYKG
jgi:hypothetical protein